MTVKLVYLTRMRVIQWSPMWINISGWPILKNHILPVVKEQMRDLKHSEGSRSACGGGVRPWICILLRAVIRSLGQCADANVPPGSLFLLIFSNIDRSVLWQQRLKAHRGFQKSKNCPAVWNSFHCINGQHKSGLGSLGIFSLKELPIRFYIQSRLWDILLEKPSKISFLKNITLFDKYAAPEESLG